MLWRGGLARDELDDLGIQEARAESRKLLPAKAAVRRHASGMLDPDVLVLGAVLADVFDRDQGLLATTSMC